MKYSEVPVYEVLEGADELSPFINQAPKQPLAVEIARKVTSKHNQDARIIVVGMQGRGKSWLSLTLGYGIACEIARIQNRKKGVNKKWSDYFNLDNIVVMDERRVKEVLSDVKQYNVYCFDDIGIAWSAREAMSRGNRLLNDVFQVFRTENTVVMMSIISDFLIDKVPRNLVNYQIEMDMSLFDYGWTLPKVFYVVGKPRGHAPHYHYPRTTEGVAVVRFASPTPPKELWEQYDKLRREAAREIRVERMKADEEEREKKEKKNKPVKKFTNEEKYRAVEKMIAAGLSQRKACEIVDCDRKNFRNWLKEKERNNTELQQIEAGAGA